MSIDIRICHLQETYPKNMEIDYWALLQKKELDYQKVVHKAAETTDEFNSEQNCETKICTY